MRVLALATCALAISACAASTPASDGGGLDASLPLGCGQWCEPCCPGDRCVSALDTCHLGYCMRGATCDAGVVVDP